MAGKIRIEVVTEPVWLGEGPHWDAEKQVLYYVDVYSSLIHCYNPVSNENFCAKLGPKPVTFIIPIQGTTDKFVISHGGDLEIITWDCKSKTVQERIPYITVETNPKVRMNDGKASPSGILFAGSMGEKLPPDNVIVPPGLGNLFVFDTLVKPPSMKTLIKNIGISNGLAWNKNETILYWADTLDRKVYLFDYDRQTLTIKNQKLLIDFEKTNVIGKPDGMAIDQEGYLWISCVEGGHQVIKVDPKKGTVIRQIDFGPVSDPTSVAFGGPNLQDMYVTTIAKDGQKNSGAVHRLTCLGTKGYAGVPVKIELGGS